MPGATVNASLTKDADFGSFYIAEAIYNNFDGAAAARLVAMSNDEQEGEDEREEIDSTLLLTGRDWKRRAAVFVQP